MNKKKIAKYGLITAVAAVLFVFYLKLNYHMVLQTNMDGDYSSLLQEADDIVHGNVFLKGWTQTGISFFLTDLLYFDVAVKLLGVGKDAYAATMVMMIACAMLSSYLLVEKKKNWKNTLVFFALTALPSLGAVSIQRAHTGGYIWVFIMIALVGYCYKKKTVNWQCAVGIVFLDACCAMSDMATLLYGVGAILTVGLFILIFSPEKSEQGITKKFWRMQMYLTIVGSSLGIVADKLYYVIGGANKNSFVSSKVFISLSTIDNHIFTYLESVFLLNNANIWSTKVLSIDNVFRACYAVFTVVGMYLVVWNIVRLVKHKNQDIISVLLSVGFALLSIVFIFTEISIDVLSSRYFSVLPYIFAVLICRHLELSEIRDKKIYTSRISWGLASTVLAVIVLIGGYYGNKMQTKEWAYTSEQELLADYLQTQGLSSGYGPFMESAPATVKTKGAVKVRPILLTGEDCIYPYYWFIKEQWFTEYANFIVVDTRTDDYGIYNETVIAAVGKPEKILKFNSYEVYVYDYDISSKIELTDIR